MFLKFKLISPSAILLALTFLHPAFAGAETRGGECGKRMDFSSAIDSLVADMVKRLPSLGHVDPSQVLFIAADARHSSRATLRPTRFPDGKRTNGSGTYVKPKISWKGKDIKYMIELRPKFFRDSTEKERIATIIHELLHMSTDFDGTIPSSKSHRNPAADDISEQSSILAGEYMSSAPAGIIKPMGMNGEVMMRQWLERPPFRIKTPVGVKKTNYNERDVFTGPMIIITGNP